MEGIGEYPLGDSLLLVRGEPAPLFVLNQAGQAIWRGVAAGLPARTVAATLARTYGLPETLARAEVSNALDSWRRAGLIGTPATPEPAPLTSKAPRRRSIPGSSRRTYSLCGSPIEVAFGSPALEALIQPKFGHSEVPGARPVARLGLARTRGGYALFEAGREPQLEATALDLSGAFTRRFVEISSGSRDWIAVLHAAAVGDDRGAIVLPGNNGCGKSTLVTALVARGFSYLSDDCAPLDARGRVIPVPYAICLKESGWAIAARHMPAVATAPVQPYGDLLCKYLPPPSPRYLPLAPRLIAFPRFDAAAGAAIRRLGPPEVLRRLVDSRAWLSRRAEDLRVSLRLLEATPAYEIGYPSLEAALDLVGTLQASEPAGPPAAA